MLPLNQMNGENTMRHLKYLILIFFCLAGSLSAQSRTPRQFLYLDDWTYDLVEYWINNSSLTVPFVLNQPYSIADIEKNLELENNWTRLQKRYYDLVVIEYMPGKEYTADVLRTEGKTRSQ